MQVDWLSSDWVIFAVKLSFQSLKLVFGDNFEKCAQLVPEYFSTVFSLAEPLKLTAFKAWMLGSLQCLDYETIKVLALVGNQAARATTSIGYAFDQTFVTSTPNPESVDPSLLIVHGGEIYYLLLVADLSIGE